jgi:hypothetical protein
VGTRRLTVRSLRGVFHLALGAGVIGLVILAWSLFLRAAGGPGVFFVADADAAPFGSLLGGRDATSSEAAAEPSEEREEEDEDGEEAATDTQGVEEECDALAFVARDPASRSFASTSRWAAPHLEEPRTRGPPRG